MTDNVKSALVGALMAGTLAIGYDIYRNSQQNLQRQTDVQRKSMLDFTQTLETLAFNLNKEDYAAFESNANKFDERMERSEFDAFLDYRRNNPPFSGFDKQLSVLTGELDSFRRARTSYLEVRKRISGLLTRPDTPRPDLPKAEGFRELVVDAVRPPSVLIALEPLRKMADQLRFEMRLRDARGN